MAKHNETGIKGELIAQNFLLKDGYSILELNWRYGKKEVDVIAAKDNRLIFIEVKTRSNFNFGFPEESVTAAKKGFLKAAAEAYGDAHPEYKEVQFDIISVHMQHSTVKEILHLKDAFY